MNECGQVAPTRIDFPGAGRDLVVKLATGERHVSALTLGCTPPPRGWDKDKQWKKVVGRYVSPWQTTRIVQRVQGGGGVRGETSFEVKVVLVPMVFVAEDFLLLQRPSRALMRKTEWSRGLLRFFKEQTFARVLPAYVVNYCYG